MKFKGYGIIFNPRKQKLIVSFKQTPEYETNDPEEIRLLRESGYITEESGVEVKEIITDEPEDKELTKSEVMESLDASGIKYNPRDKKEVLLSLLEG